MAQDDISHESSQDSKNSKDAFFDPKPKPKMIRFLTVLAYVLSVSMAAIFLSVYYIFMWHGEPHLGAQRSIFVNHSVHERTTGLKNIPLPKNRYNPIPPLQVAYSQPLISVDEDNKTTDSDNITGSDVTDTTEMMIVDKENTTERDMQRQLIALESETRDPSTTLSSEDNTTAWQEYVDSPEDLSKSNIFLKKLFDKNEENY
ncbi:unnamed protein product [Psylliodes chrysocephalus]|uniref:Uncharacterized protein n=1 Tax=Psylliodes chrysocephalus TaxID=3402493 RepID=A0A9P0D3N5_9CUCU|nr:unnamed protein product [Psylliodes chrysocephala]